MRPRKGKVWYNPELTEDERRQRDREYHELMDGVTDRPEKKNKQRLDVEFEFVRPGEPLRQTAYRQWRAEQAAENVKKGSSDGNG
ncbi:MAG: hypothetical protein AAF563_12400 [Pseudomonadota bacterium]